MKTNPKIIYRSLRGESKVERVCAFSSVAQADRFIEYHKDPSGGWIYYREPTVREMKNAKL
ncbi:MAG: hypothetical protein PHY56_04125 [Candidatus Omnitrophica bacterium]|nr:hypothetical protein [Candidatus Omnitrophota bacterium]